MKKLLLTIILLILLTQPVFAMEFEAPTVPEAGREYMPEQTESFGKDLWYIIQNALSAIRPEIFEAAKVCIGIVCIVLLSSLIAGFSERTKKMTEFTAVTGISVVLLRTTNTLINLGAQTVTQIGEYSKLLMPVMTAALAAQGGVTSSAAMYTGTSVFCAVLTNMIAKLLIPALYIFLCMCIACNAITEDILVKLRDFTKWVLTWSLKIILYVFTGYISITGVVSGSADASLIKATKLTISGSVPVVGSILSDASESILVSAGLMKNAAGVYGVLAIIALWIGPFLKIGIQYLLIKITAAICGIFGTKHTVALLNDFATAMGFILAMISTISLLLTIALVCFMKGVA